MALSSYIFMATCSIYYSKRGLTFSTIMVDLSLSLLIFFSFCIVRLVAVWWGSHIMSPRYALAKATVIMSGHCWPVPLKETFKHLRQVWLSLCGVSGSWCAQGFVWALWASLVGMAFDSKHDFAPPTILLGLLLCTWTQGSFSGGIQHCPVDGCSAVSCSFGGLTGEDDCTSFYSAVLCLYI